MKLLTQLKKTVRGEWRYKGNTNRYMRQRAWTNGRETLSIHWQDGAKDWAGWVVEVEGRNRDATLRLSNGFVESFDKALVLADIHMRGGTVSAFMASDKCESDTALGGLVRQDEWLDAHASEYEFAVIDPTEVSRP